MICPPANTSTKRNVVLLVSSLSQGHETRWREDRSGIADVEADSFFKYPRLLEVISAACKETVIAVNVLGSVVTEAKSGDQLFATHPFLIDESIGPEARPEKPAHTGTNRQRAVPVRIEGVGIPGRQVYPSVAEFVLTVDLGAPDVLSLRYYTASVSARPVAEAVRQ